MASARDVMMAQVVGGAGFIAALDQSGGSTPGALKQYGYSGNEWSDDAGMYDLIHRMRVRIITAPAFASGKVVGAILFERTMDGQADGAPVPTALWRRGVVPFLKVDKGLQDEADGVQLMKPIDGLAPLLERAQAEAILADELKKGLDALTGDRRVMLKLTIPAERDLYAPLIAHPRVARVVALSGGYSQTEACAELAKNRGLIASFSRALLEGLTHQQSDEEFDATLARSIDAIHLASTVKDAPAQ